MERKDLERMAITGAIRIARDMPLKWLTTRTPKSIWMRYGLWGVLALIAALWEALH